MITPNLNSPPDAVLLNAFFPYLNHKNLCRLGSINRRFRDLTNTPSLWISFLSKNFSEYLEEVRSYANTNQNQKVYKLLFCQFHLIKDPPLKFSLHDSNGRSRDEWLVFDKLKYADSKGLETAIHILVKTVKDEDLRKKFYFTSSAWGHEYVVKEFLKCRDVNERDDRQMTPLHGNSMNGTNSIVNTLIEAGADINLQDRHGWTPLHWAVRNETLQVVIDLIAAGADKTKKDLIGRIPVQMRFGDNEYSVSRRSLPPAILAALEGKTPSLEDVKKLDSSKRLRPNPKIKPSLITRITNWIKSFFAWMQSKIKSLFGTTVN